MNKILVTGGAGFIGSHVVDAVVARYPCAQICVLDKLNYAANINFIIDHLQSRRVAFMAGDITDYPAMLSATHGADLSAIPWNSHVPTHWEPTSSWKHPANRTLHDSSMSAPMKYMGKCWPMGQRRTILCIPTIPTRDPRRPPK